MMPSASSVITLFGLLRHGETSWNVEKRIQGSGDSALTPAGRADCTRWGRLLASAQPAWDRIISSPQQRAMGSARLVNKQMGLPLLHEDGLREQHWGSWEGMTIAEVQRSFPGELEQRTAAGWDFRPPGGESRREVLARASEALRRLAERWPQEKVLLVTHLGVIKVLLYHIEGRNFLPQEPVMVRKNRFHTISSAGGSLAIVSRDIALPVVP